VRECVHLRCVYVQVAALKQQVKRVKTEIALSHRITQLIQWKQSQTAV